MSYLQVLAVENYAVKPWVHSFGADADAKGGLKQLMRLRSIGDFRTLCASTRPHSVTLWCGS